MLQWPSAGGAAAAATIALFLILGKPSSASGSSSSSEVVSSADPGSSSDSSFSQDLNRPAITFTAILSTIVGSKRHHRHLLNGHITSDEIQTVEAFSKALSFFLGVERKAVLTLNFEGRHRCPHPLPRPLPSSDSQIAHFFESNSRRPERYRHFIYCIQLHSRNSQENSHLGS